MELQWPQMKNTEIVEASFSTFEKVIDSCDVSQSKLVSLKWTEKIETEVVRDVREVGRDWPEVIDPPSPEKLINLNVWWERTQPRYKPYNAHLRPLSNNQRLRQQKLSLRSTLLPLPRQTVQQQRFIGQKRSTSS